MQSYGELVRELRKKRNMTLKELANKVELSEFDLAQIENSIGWWHNPYTNLLLAKALDYPFADLLVASGTIDEYEDADHVRWVFEQLDLDSEMKIHIRNVDDFDEEVIEREKGFFKSLQSNDMEELKAIPGIPTQTIFRRRLPKVGTKNRKGKMNGW